MFEDVIVRYRSALADIAGRVANKSQGCRFESNRREVRKISTINEDDKIRRVIE